MIRWIKSAPSGLYALVFQSNSDSIRVMAAIGDAMRLQIPTGAIHTWIEGGPERHDLRSRAETKLHGVKLLGQRLSARDFYRQAAEFRVHVAVANGFTALGITVTEVVG